MQILKSTYIYANVRSGKKSHITKISKSVTHPWSLINATISDITGNAMKSADDTTLSTNIAALSADIAALNATIAAVIRALSVLQCFTLIQNIL